MGILHTLFFLPTYNIFAFVSYLALNNFFWITILVIVVVVKILLIPMVKKQNKLNSVIKKIQIEIKEINKKEKDAKKRTEQTLEVYKKHKLNPLSPLLPIFVQIPIFLSIFVVVKNIQNNLLNQDFLYFGGSFFSNIDYSFVFGSSLTSSGSVVFAIAVAASQFCLFCVIFSKNPNQNKQVANFMKYAFTIVSGVVVFSIGNAVALYWLANNVFSIIQDLFLIKKEK